MDKQQIAGYKIEGTLGEGGMGVVYRARDVTLDRAVAVKVIRSENLGPLGKERFIREAQACSRINHPNIVTVYAAGESDGLPYIAMELVEGKSLREVIDEGPVPWQTVLCWFGGILDALARLHEEGIVHRDLKPENIMITSDGVAKLMDFGIAHLTSTATITQAGTTLGTVFYMSPEQVAAKKVDARSDLFSIGAVLYETLTGVLPFQGEHPMSVMYCITNEAPKPLKDHAVDLPDEIQGIVDRTLEKDPAKRFVDAEELRNVLAEVLSGRAPAATALGGTQRNARFVAIFLPGTVLLALAAVVMVIFWQRGNHEQRRQLAVHHNELGQSLQEQGELGSARDEYRKAILADPKYAPAVNNLAMLSWTEGDLAEADSLLRTAVSLKPDYTAALFNLGEVSWDRKDFTGAEKHYRAAIAADSSFIQGYNNLGALFLALGRTAEALDVLDGGLAKERQSPTSAPIKGHLLKNRGRALALLGREGEAFDDWSNALELLPGEIELHRSLAEWHERHGNKDGAITHWKEVAQAGGIEDRKNAEKALERLLAR